MKGAFLIFEYCRINNIPYKNSGKLIIATKCDQINVLKKLHDRGTINGVRNLKILCNLEEIIKVEVNAKGMQALWSPNTGNVDFRLVTESFGEDFRKNGGDVLLNNKVSLKLSEDLFLMIFLKVNFIKPSGDCDYPVLLKCNEGLYLKSKYLILCGGLRSGTLSDFVDKDNERIFISFRVDYKLLKNKYIATNIYAVPDLSVPFLGAHVTPRSDCTTLLGPTAVPACNIEGYE